MHLSPEFRKQTSRAISSVIFFFLICLVILILAAALTALCVVAGVSIIVVKPGLATALLGLGLSSLGILVLVFLLKFIFATNKKDLSHLEEVTREEEPGLFDLIDEIVRKVDTRYPKKVYLSNEVNAAVFYDSGFWSMFLPVEKNLLIGLGLVNTVSREELKAVLSHEFGHFSQRTMKVGSYVNNVNLVIFNMLYDNDAYQNIIRQWGRLSGFFSFFVIIAVKIVEGIQWVLRRLYGIVNKNYLGLSREMEFNADEIAAGVTGYEPLQSALLRLSLADDSFSNVLNFYSEKTSVNLISENLYKDQSAVIRFISEINRIPLRNGLPEISADEQAKFDRSKLVIKNQWASHPTTAERIARLEKTNLHASVQSDSPANQIFRDIEETQKKLTARLFETVSFTDTPNVCSSENFLREYKVGIISNQLPEIFNGYYDNKNISRFDLTATPVPDNASCMKELFPDSKIELVYTAISMQNDMETLKNISDGSSGISTFDYDGIRYRKKDAAELAEKLKPELEKLNEDIVANDKKIYAFFHRLENERGNSGSLENLYRQFFQLDSEFEAKYDSYIRLLNDLQFIGTTTPYETIKSNLENIRPQEEALRAEIRRLSSDALYREEITAEMNENFEKYISQPLEYFNGQNYMDENLRVLYTAAHQYAYLLSRGYFLMKKKILVYQEQLLMLH